VNVGVTIKITASLWFPKLICATFTISFVGISVGDLVSVAKGDTVGDNTVVFVRVGKGVSVRVGKGVSVRVGKGVLVGRGVSGH
jgi:hypothetical protein